jgi:hypothetical protein
MFRKIFVCEVVFLFTCASFATGYKVDHKGFGSEERNKIITDKNIVVTADRFCKMGKTFLTEGISFDKTRNNFSRYKSYQMSLSNSLSVDDLERIAQADECVVSISKDIKVELHGLPNDPKFEKQSQLGAIQFGETFDFFSNTEIKKDVILAVIDNGMDIKHEDLKENLWVNSKEANGLPGIDDDRNGYIDDIHGYDFMSGSGDPNHKYTDQNLIHSHGTHVAGLAAAATNNGLGVAGVMTKKVKIMPLNVFGNEDFSSFAVINNAIRYAADMGANVINISLGGSGSSSSTEDAIRYAVSKNVLVVVSAGNNSDLLTEKNFSTPASYGATIKGMLTVGAIDSGKKFGELCSFSNYSPIYVEISAPGCHSGNSGSGILSTIRKNQYGLLEGTSMASPVTAGVALVAFSYLREHGKKLKAPQLEEFLKNASKSSSILSDKVQDGKTVDLQALKDKIIAQ